MIPKSDLRKTLLDCMEFFRDELRFGLLTERVESKYEELLEKCYNALGKPSIANCYDIREDK